MRSAKRGEHGHHDLRFQGTAPSRVGAGYDAGQPSVDGLAQGREGPVAARHDPRRRPLEHAETSHARRNLRHKLDGAAVCADHGHSLAPQVEGVIPARRVNAFSAKIHDAGQCGDDRLAQPAGAENRIARTQAALARVGAPGLAADIECRAHNQRIEADLVLQAILLRRPA